MDTQEIIERLLKLGKNNVEERNKPFSCIIVKNNQNGNKEIIAEGVDKTQYGDPTATAVMIAIDKTARKLGGFKDLKNCEVYLLTYPDPMSLAALYHSTPDKVIFLLETQQYSKYYSETKKYFSGINDFYQQIPISWQNRKMPMESIRNLKGVEPFKLWHQQKTGKSVESGNVTQVQIENKSIDDSTHEYYIERAIALANENVKNGGNPFSCVVVKRFPDSRQEIVAEAVNEIHKSGNPTDHSEIIAIRKTIEKLGPTKDLSDCTFYMLPHPCPMCLSGMYLAAPGKVIFSLNREDFAPYFQNTGRLYKSAAEFTAQFDKPWDQQLLPMQHVADCEAAIDIFKYWEKLNGSPHVNCIGFNDNELPLWGEPNHLRKLLNYPASEILETIAYNGNATNQFLLATRTLNKTVREHYKEWNNRVGNNIYPLIVALDIEPESEGVGSTFRLYLRDGSIKRIRPTPPMYEIQKNVSHLALGLATIVSPYFSYPATIFSKTKLSDLQNKIQQALITLQHVNLDSSDKDYYIIAKQLLEVTSNYTNKYILNNSATIEDLREYGKKIMPLLKQSGKIAAELQMKAIINGLYNWKQELGPDEWRKLHAVIPTVWPVSSDNPRETALRYVMDPSTVDTNLIIAEGAKDEAEARVTLARTKDKAVAHLIFGTEDIDSRSMICAYSSPRDLLADAVDEAVQKLHKNHEIPPNSNNSKNIDSRLPFHRCKVDTKHNLFKSNNITELHKKSYCNYKGILNIKNMNVILKTCLKFSRKV